MQPILEQFFDKWVWPTMPGAPGAEFRLRLTRERCVKGWEISLEHTLAGIERVRRNQPIGPCRAIGKATSSWVLVVPRSAPW
jgi:hypothetical protein